MRESEYVDSLIGEYQILAQKSLKNTNSEYDESEILKNLWFRRIAPNRLHVGS
jgi:hypothetical protein